MSAAKPNHDYNYKTEFEIWRKNQEFERQNFLMSQPPLDLTPIVTDTTNVTTSHLDLTPDGTKMPDHKPLTQPTDLSKCKETAHVLGDPESDPSLSYSSSNKYDSSNDSKYSKSKSKECN